MKIILPLTLLVALVGLCGCASIEQMPYTVEVRRNSFTSDDLFRDILGAVLHTDEAQYPRVARRTLHQVEAIERTHFRNATEPGIERWTVLHDGENPVVYLITITPDTEGYASFAISLDAGGAPR